MQENATVENATVEYNTYDIVQYERRKATTLFRLRTHKKHPFY